MLSNLFGKGEGTTGGREGRREDWRAGGTCKCSSLSKLSGLMTMNFPRR